MGVCYVTRFVFHEVLDGDARGHTGCAQSSLDRGRMYTDFDFFALTVLLMLVHLNAWKSNDIGI